MRKNYLNKNNRFIDSAILNSETYQDYLNRFRKIALSMFEWVNLPKSMNENFIEKCLFYNGKCAFLKDKTKGFINTKVCSNGYLNIYGLPTKLHCFSYDYQEDRDLFSYKDELIENQEEKECIYVLNNTEVIPTVSTLELFAYRLYMCDRVCDVNLSGQRYPLMILGDEKARLTLENLYSQYDGNKPFIFGKKDLLSENEMKVLKTDSPYIIDRVTQYKKEIWNEALTFLGINNMSIVKGERLTKNESEENNELVNLNLLSFLKTRQQACREFNELFGFTGTDKEISVRVRSDLYNVIKQNESIVSDYLDNGRIDDEKNAQNLEKTTEKEEVFI